MNKLRASLVRMIGRVKRNMPALFLTVAIFFMGLAVVALQSTAKGSFDYYIVYGMGIVGTIMLLFSFYLTRREDLENKKERQHLIEILESINSHLEAEREGRSERNNKTNSDNL